MTGGQDDAANLIHTSDGSEWPKARIEWEELGNLRLCRELLRIAVREFESCEDRFVVPGCRRPLLMNDWADDARKAINEERP